MSSGDEKRRGRPPKPQGARTQGNFTFRTLPALREHLQRAAEASGRSVSEEITYRLQRSFDNEATLQDIACCLRAVLSEHNPEARGGPVFETSESLASYLREATSQ